MEQPEPNPIIEEPKEETIEEPKEEKDLVSFIDHEAIFIGDLKIYSRFIIAKDLVPLVKDLFKQKEIQDYLKSYESKRKQKDYFG